MTPLRFAPILALAAALCMPVSAAAQESTLVLDTITFEKARVISASEAVVTTIPGTDALTTTQTLEAEVLGTGARIVIENDYAQLAPGDVFYARHTVNELDGLDTWALADPYRLPVLLGLTVLFLILVSLFGGMPGVRGFASFCGSIVLIFTVLVPGILNGYSPIIVSIGVAGLIIVVGSYITHGFSRMTTSAVLGMLATVSLTGILAFWAVHAAHLTGYAAEESIYLTFDTRGSIDLVGLLFGGIMIGLLGVLYDIAIGQAIAVEELYRAGAGTTPGYVYRRALRIGREHIGALVNTLAIAYVGASLPLLLLVSNSADTGLAFTMNSEVFATEIIRILIGSIGLVLAVPVTTLIAERLLRDAPLSAERAHEGHRHA